MISKPLINFTCRIAQEKNASKQKQISVCIDWFVIDNQRDKRKKIIHSLFLTCHFVICIFLTNVYILLPNHGF